MMRLLLFERVLSRAAFLLGMLVAGLQAFPLQVATVHAHALAPHGGAAPAQAASHPAFDAATAETSTASSVSTAATAQEVPWSPKRSCCGQCPCCGFGDRTPVIADCGISWTLAGLPATLRYGEALAAPHGFRPGFHFPPRAPPHSC
jgi:hypothetical protein